LYSVRPGGSNIKVMTCKNQTGKLTKLAATPIIFTVATVISQARAIEAANFGRPTFIVVSAAEP
ncbi:MAG TPA: hypothetical protein VL096_09285, partial [Pirellulaceae bacterium]|nr:hypothetical protein [Pirellulaceae bacterium]